MSAIAEEWDLYVLNYQLNEANNENAKKELYAGEVLKSIIVDEELEIEENQVQDIRKLIKQVGKEEEKYVIIHEGEF